MAIPTGIDYAAPTLDLPASRADWPLERGRAAVLVHDLQRYFVRPYAPGCPALVGALEATARILQVARAAGVPVYYTAQTGTHADVARGLQADIWGPGMQPDPEHTAILAEVEPAPGDVILAKHRYSAFVHSDLADRLAANGRDQLVITGVYAHIGVLATAMDAFQREVRPFVVADAVADFGLVQHRRALEQVASCSGVVTISDRVVDALAPAGSSTVAVPAQSVPTSADPSGASSWERVLRAALGAVMPATFVDAALADAEADLFALGLDSLRAFEVLDELADAGVDIDFGEFTRTPTLTHLRARGAALADGASVS